MNDREECVSCNQKQCDEEEAMKPADSGRVAKARRISEIAEREKKATKGPWTKWVGHPSVFCENDGTNSDWEMSGNQICECEPDDLPDLDGDDDENEELYAEQAEDNAEFIAHARADIPFLLSELASERQAVIEECCRAVCDCCGKYAQYWHPAELVNERWRHISTKVPDEGKPTTHLCDAAAIRSMGE